MVLFLTEREVRGLLDMQDAMQAVEEALREQGRGEATNQPRQRVSVDGVTLHVLPAAVPGPGSMGLKAAPHRVSMASYRWGSGCIPAQ